MSDTSQGPGWWQASDGKWYPPEQAPGYVAPTPGAAPAGGAPAGGSTAFDLGAAFNWTWTKFQQNMQPLLILGAVVVLIPFLISLVGLFINSAAVGLGLWILRIIVGYILLLLLTQASLKIVRGETIDTSQMFALEGNVGGYIVGAILFGIASIIGFCFLCVGFFLVWMILGLWNFILVDRNVGPTDALTGSKDLVLGPGFGVTFLPMLVFTLIALIGSPSSGYGGFFFVSVVGVFTQPFAYLLGAYIYKNLSGQPVAA